MTTLRTILVLLAASFGGIAWADDTNHNDGIAQEDSSDDELGDILGGSTGDGEGDSSAETQDFARGDSSPDKDNVVLVENDNSKKRLIKTIQKKNFYKKGRWEASPHFAFVANDPFLNRYIVGAGLIYNLTEIFAVEVNMDFSPDLGDADWKPVTKQLIEENHVSPDISNCINGLGNLVVQDWLRFSAAQIQPCRRLRRLI